MTIQFPDTPSQGNSFVATNGVSYTYDNGGWTANSQLGLDDRFVNVDGDTMTGDLAVPNLVATGDLTAVDVTASGDVVATGDVQSTSQNGGQLAGFRNQLINSDFRIWQRGEDLSITGSQVKYGPDRWFFRANSSVGASSTEAKLVQDGPISKCRIVYNGTPTGPGYIQQRIETQNIQGLYGKELTFSFYLENVSMSPAPVPTVSITAYGSGGSATQLVDSNNPITSLGNNRYSVTYTYATSDGTVNNATGFGMSISVQINGASTVAANACQFWNAQLEVGPVATPFEQRPIGTELALCQRYYQKSYDTSSPPASNQTDGICCAHSNSNGEFVATVRFATAMRVGPTVTLYNPTGGSSSLSVGSTVGHSGFFATQLGGTVSSSSRFHFVADAEL